MTTTESYETASGATLYAVRYRKPDSRQAWKRGFKRKADAQWSPALSRSTKCAATRRDLG